MSLFLSVMLLNHQMAFSHSERRVQYSPLQLSYSKKWMDWNRVGVEVGPSQKSHSRKQYSMKHSTLQDKTDKKKNPHSKTMCGINPIPSQAYAKVPPLVLVALVANKEEN